MFRTPFGDWVGPIGNLWRGRALLWSKHLTVTDYFPGAIEDVTWAGRRR